MSFVILFEGTCLESVPGEGQEGPQGTLFQVVSG